MVRIVDFKERTSEDGKAFFVLEIQSDMEMVLSQKTGQYYATARKASITSTFTEETCKSLIGTELPGRIEKQDCSAYDYVIEDTGETIELSHKYVYVPMEETETTNHQQKVEVDANVFSENGILEPAM